jgi:hypothetical protein
MNQIEGMERAVMSLLIRCQGGIDPVYLNQIPNLSVTSRVFTGKGFYTNFNLDLESLRDDDKAFDISSEVINSPAFNSLMIGFVLFIKHGAIAMLEGYTFDASEWPGERLLLLKWPDDVE